MNNKGFTLIELIATILLLGVLAIIAFVSITGILSQSKVNDCENLVNNIKSAAKDYVSDNRYSNVFNNVYDNVLIDAGSLVNGKYLSSPIINPFTKEEIKLEDVKIKIKLNNDYTVKSVDIEAPSILANCESGI